jgi:hypothetical protein
LVRVRSAPRALFEISEADFENALLPRLCQAKPRGARCHQRQYAAMSPPAASSRSAANFAALRAR